MIIKLLSTYGFSSGKDFLLSLFPSFKYGSERIALALSTVLGAVANFLGLTPALVLAMFIAVLVETFTGRRASKKRGEPFESYKFSRCIIKVFIWVAILYILHSFAMEMQDSSNVVYQLGYYFFVILKLVTMVYFVIEYLTSILENLAEIEGKPKDTLVNAMWGMFKDFRLRMAGLLKKKGGNKDGDSME